MQPKKTICVAAIMVAVMVFGSAFVSASPVVLEKESEGTEVAALQKDLIKLGYLSSEATGYYGDLTENAVKKIQRDYGYEVDGIAGKDTFSLLDRIMGRNKALPNPNLMQEGDENSYVTSLQQDLIKLGYLYTNATGFYGPATKAAVTQLQNKYGYAADGIVGSATLGLISDLKSGKGPKPVEKAATAASAAKTEIKPQDDYMLKWFGVVEEIWGRGDNAVVYDIETGKSFNIKRTYGSNHADCETLTKADTAIMKEVFSGKWSWERRAVIVKVDGYDIAACMTGYPHAGMDKYQANKTIASRSGGYKRGTNFDAVKSNNMDGVFDIHFLNSRNHYNNKVDPKHQAKIREAAQWAEKNAKKEKADEGSSQKENAEKENVETQSTQTQNTQTEGSEQLDGAIENVEN